MKIVVSLVAVLVITAVVVFFTTAQNTPTPLIDQAAFQALMASDSKPLLLDVRTPKEFAEGHVHGATNISHDQLEHRLAELGTDKSQEIVVYCRSGRRAAFAEGVLRGAGFTNLKHLEGDMLGWQKAGLKTES
ncbi:MAG: phage shock protein E [Candidatus Azotimanducaceae bacterium]|jgi:phage shock protein E